MLVNIVYLLVKISNTPYTLSYWFNVLRSVVIIIVVVIKTFHFSVFRPTLLNAGKLPIGTNDVTTIDKPRDSKFSEIEFIIVFSWKIVFICNDCKWQKSFFCIYFSKYRLITNLGILCLWSLKLQISFCQESDSW